MTQKIKFEANARNRVKRGLKRAKYDTNTVYGILDSHFLCHVAFEVDGQPHVIPTSHWRDGNRLYWHGSSKSFMVRHLAAGNPAAVSVTHLDGLVLARSGFSSSVNYRSAICYGQPELVTDDKIFDEQLELFFENLAPGRWPNLRTMTEQERKATALIEMEIEDAVAKVRTGPPGDDEEADFPIWAGVVPLTTTMGEPEAADPNCPHKVGHTLMPTFAWGRE